MIDEEGELMRRVAAEEPRAFERLVARVLPRLLGYFRRLGADAATAEDCAQEVLLKLYRVRAGYEHRARFMTYLLHVARNHWIDLYRHRRLGPVTVSADRGPAQEGEESTGSAAERLEGPVSDPARAAYQPDLRQALDLALARLSPEHREAFVLAHLDTLRYEEIAEVLGVPVGTVKSRVHTAARLLREHLGRAGIEP